ncbi:MAG: hypothetical protein HYZ46_08970 [Nitrosomonadales bacterium]|nr:hypothetical protein [Nitrosomonadales bacterium]
MRYFAHFSFAVLSLSAALAGFNWWVDPYAIYHQPVEDAAASRVMNERIFKTVKLARTPADVVFIGTSRTDIGIGREQPTLRGRRLVNLATFGQPFRETRRLFEQVVQNGRAKTVVIGLDFFAFNALFVPPSDYVEDNYSSLRPATLLLSISTLSDALTKYRNPQVTGGECCYADGFRLATDPGYLKGNYHRYFTASERMYLMEKYLPYPQCAFAFAVRGREAQSSLADLQAIFELAQHRQIDLRLFISPSHARQWETLAAAGLWDTWENWKRRLVELNDQSAMQAGRQPFPIWDFSGYDSVSGEDLPTEGDNRLMQGYSDSSHYTLQVGQRLVSRLFGQEDNWGEQLGRANIEARLTNIRAARQQYRSSHSADVAEIEALLREVVHAKRCPDTR